MQGPYGDRGIGFYNESLFKKIITEKPADMDFFWFLQPHKPVPSFAAYSGRHVVMSAAKPEYWYVDKISELKLDAFHCTCPFGDFPIPKVGNIGCRTIATIYDLIPLKLPFYFTAAINKSDYMSRLQTLKTYHTLLTISDSVKDDIVRYLSYPSAKISVIGAGVDEDFLKYLPNSDLALRSKHSITQPYLLCTGGDDPRKNMPRLIEAFGLIPPRLAHYKLVIVCDLSPSTKKALLAKALEVGVQERLILTGFVPKGILITLYRFASAFVFPSLAEGFGLPILEAMACGTPVITSSGRPFTDVAGDAAIYFDPYNPHSIASAISSVLDYKATRFLLSQKGLKRAASMTWTSVARAVVAAYADADRRSRANESPQFERLLATIPLQRKSAQPASVSALASASALASVSALASASVLASASTVTGQEQPQAQAPKKKASDIRVWPAVSLKKGSVYLYSS